jgi:hypothetical protein
MSRRMGVICAGVLLLAATGCPPGSFLMSPSGSFGKPQVVSGSIDEVSARLQEGLSEAGISVVVASHNGELRLAGMTPAHKIFCIHLKRPKSASVEKTGIVVQWDRETDESFDRLVATLAAAPAGDDSSSTDAANPRAGSPLGMK